ncbi:meiosis protein SPO22/ZIP4 like-domain-containing protein [Earliella scabrosa]|nr:meiosis protein SPO22/ZIP4 like-domain-containing protein [Earliella scabrosa]
MSDRKKRKLSPDSRTAYSNIQYWNTLRSDLLQLSALAESLSKHRPRAKKEDWSHRADELDREGVALWNASVVQRDVPDEAYRSVCAALRLAGFRLIEAGMEPKPRIESLIHVLQLASKAGASLAGQPLASISPSTITPAPYMPSCSRIQYEELLRPAEDPQGENAQARARAVMLYYSSRMEAAWRERNVGVAEFMLEKVTESDQYLSLLTPSDRRTLAGKLLGIGKELLRSSTQEGPAGNSARDSVKWIQRAFSTIEPLEDAADTGDGQLRRSILRSLARAYFLSSSQDPENLARAEASLQELIESVDTSLDHTSAEYQQLRWMRVAILKRRTAPHAPLLEAFRSIIDHMEFSESNITDVLQEMRTLGHDHTLVTAIHLHCLHRAFEAQNSAGLVYLDRLLLSLIFHCSKDDEHSRAMHEVDNALNLLDSKDYELPKIPTTACLTLLWQFGDRHYHSKRWSEAADWFLVGTHRVFGSMSHISNPKCLRKAALCYIQCGEHAQASAIIRRCPPTDAATHYVALLIATHQAVAAVHEMVHASNFNKKMLLLATRLANESGMKHLLLSVLEALLDASTRSGLEVEAEAVTLVRCIIRLVLRMMSEPGANLTGFVPMLLRHFTTALSLVTALESKQGTAVVGTKDISWLWRTAYNTAIQGCSDWENYEDSISDLFDIARQMLEIYLRFPAVDSETGLHVFLINASFAGAAGRVFASRHRAPTPTAQEADRQKAVAEEIIACKDRIQKVLSKAGALGEEDVQRAHSFLNVLSVFETEIACQLKTWSRILEVIEETTRTQAVDLGTFEAMTDILWVEKDCPVEVLFAALEAILHASLDRAVLSVEKFSRWLRAICTILLSRNSAADRTKAIGYVEQAVGVLQEHAADDDPQGYPMDERHWLMGTAYNTGIECLHASLLDEAKRWFEAATTVCRFVPEGTVRSEKIARTYAQLLARYSR